MRDPVEQCELDVEQARSKLSRDLATLRAPETFSAFTDDLKRDALETKDALIDQAKVAAQAKLADFVDDLKARAAANPAAALAIGAGIGWRLLHNPPIASALVGAGLYSLWRTNGFQPRDGSKPDYFGHGKERLKEQAGDLASSAKEVAADVGAAMSARTTEMIEVAKTKAQEWSETAQAKAQEWSDDVGRSAAVAGSALKAEAASAVSRATDMAAQVSHRAEDATKTSAGIATRVFQDTVSAGQEFVADRDSRDKLLLGMAGVAVAAALGIAAQKRIAEDVE
jgi:hypothetical protein